MDFEIDVEIYRLGTIELERLLKKTPPTTQEMEQEDEIVDNCLIDWIVRLR